jgi:hypothetical protein
MIVTSDQIPITRGLHVLITALPVLIPSLNQNRCSPQVIPQCGLTWHQSREIVPRFSYVDCLLEVAPSGLQVQGLDQGGRD